ncbi:MAG: TlpA disulfide reductase family protein [Chloroflexi bacterium]|nr:TlpA disulfide reductase family protein [Chloroflexota bacterium]
MLRIGIVQKYGITLVGLALILLFVAAACSSPAASQQPTSTGTQSSGETSQTATPTSQAGQSITVSVPRDFEITLYTSTEELGAEKVQFTDLFASGKPVVLNFWAGLCPPCRAEMPDFQELHDQLGDKVTIISVDIGPFVGLGNQEDALQLIDQLGLNYPTGFTLENKVVASYRVLGMPSTIFLKPDGEVQRTWTGGLNRAKLTELIEELVQES